MARKTWVKLKRGLLIDPKHRMALGNRIWLYMYMLDIADWDTGKVIEWRDKAAADELQMPLTTVRTQRRQIEEEGYISCHQHSDHQTITIKKWVNPREYSGQVYNAEGSVEEYAPLEDALKTEGEYEGVNEGVNEGIQNLTPLHINHISHITSHLKGVDADLFKACQRIYESKKGALITDGASFALMVQNFKRNGATAEDYAAAIDAMDADKRYKGSKPTSYEKWALGIADRRRNPARFSSDKKIRNDADKMDPETYRRSWQRQNSTIQSKG